MIGRARGASLLVPALILVTVAAFAVVVVAGQAGGDILSTDADAENIEALGLAETGLERALKRFATGTACGAALNETITDLSAFGLTGRRIIIGNGLGTDFSSVALRSSQTQCRIPVTGRIDATNVERTIHAIVDKNLLGGPNNFMFDNPAAPGAPSGWTLVANATSANNGGPDGAAPACSRSAWLLKQRTNSYTARGRGDAAVSFTVTGGSATTIYFHYRINDRGPDGGCAGGGATSGAAWDCPSAGANEGRICFRFRDSTGTNSYSTTLSSNNTTTVNVPCPDASGITAFNPCQSGYQAGYPTKGSVTMTIGGGGTRTITEFRFYMRLQQASRREMFLDQIEAVNNTAIGAARVQDWRDCAASSCPPI